MSQPRVRITSRRPSGIAGYTTVFAMVDDGDTGDYTIATSIVDTPQEVTEILAQSQDRMVHREATRPGID